MNENKPFFTLPCDFWEIALDKDVSLEDKGKLFEASFYYDHFKKVPEIEEKTVRLWFKDLKRAIDTGDQLYAKKCESQRLRRNKGKQSEKIIKEINDFFESISIYEYANKNGKNPEMIESFLDSMNEKRLIELEKFKQEIDEFMIRDIRDLNKITPFDKII